MNVIDNITANFKEPVDQIISSAGSPLVSHKVDNIIMNVYHALCERKRRMSDRYDWGKILLVLAIYLDIATPEPRGYRRSPEAREPENRLEEFMPHGPMQKLMGSLTRSVVFEKLEAWNRRQLRSAA
jgi:hypothetical protein